MEPYCLQGVNSLVLRNMNLVWGMLDSIKSCEVSMSLTRGSFYLLLVLVVPEPLFQYLVLPGVKVLGDNLTVFIIVFLLYLS